LTPAAKPGVVYFGVLGAESGDVLRCLLHGLSENFPLRNLGSGTA